MNQTRPATTPAQPDDRHDFDEDGCCTKCGFDGAEWHHWKHSTWEGRAQPDAKPPRCTNSYARSYG
jgi:hypothetical protein